MAYCGLIPGARPRALQLYADRRGIPGIAGKTFSVLGDQHVNIIAIAQGSSESNISFVIEEKAVKTALLTAHREFGLDASPR